MVGSGNYYLHFYISDRLLDFINISHRPLGNLHWDRPDGRIVFIYFF